MDRVHLAAVARAISRYSKSHSQRIVMPTILAEYVADELRKIDVVFNEPQFIEACRPERERK